MPFANQPTSASSGYKPGCVSQATDANEKSRTLIALAFAPTPAQINETLEFSLSDAVRAQDTTSLIVSVAARSRLSLQAAWDFVRT